VTLFGACLAERLAKSPAKPVIRVRLDFEPEPLDAKRRWGEICFARRGLFERLRRRKKRRFR
jgi:hypothetical protein